MRAENERQLLRNRIELLKAQQKKAIADIKHNRARRDALRTERLEQRSQRSQLSELQEDTLPSNPRFKAHVSRTRIEQHISIARVRADVLNARKARAQAVHAERAAAEKAQAQLEAERARAVLVARERVLADRARLAKVRDVFLEKKQKSSRLTGEGQRAKEAQVEAKRREFEELAREEASVLARLARMHEAAVEASADLEHVASLRPVQLAPRRERPQAWQRPQSGERRRELLALANGHGPGALAALR